jgi:hypothetical protein
MLCDRCNLGISHFYDRPDLLLNAATYLGWSPPVPPPIVAVVPAKRKATPRRVDTPLLDWTPALPPWVGIGNGLRLGGRRFAPSAYAPRREARHSYGGLFSFWGRFVVVLWGELFLFPTSLPGAPKKQVTCAANSPS